MRLVISLIFLAFIPTLAVLGHDAYLYYGNMNKEFMFSTLGYMWTQYEPASHDQFMQDLARQPMVVGGKEVLNPEILTAILGRKAIELAGALSVILTTLIVTVKLIAVLFSAATSKKFKAKRKHF